jgi:hypothetical protein
MAEPRIDADNRCSVLSRLRDDSMLGTAFDRGGVLLIEIPGPWGHDALTESRFDSAVADELSRRAHAAGLRPLAIRKPGRSDPDARRRWAVRPAGSSVTYWGYYEEDGDLLDIPLTGAVGEPDAESLYLVCAHSKRDQCCAMFGRPIAAAIEAQRPGRVWECSHTGGHRFAPVVLALPGSVPGGALYGRIEIPDARQIIAATEQGRTLPQKLRGELGHSEVVQAALAAVRQQTGLAGFEDLAVLESDERVPGESSVRLKSADGTEFAVEVRATLGQVSFASCGKPKPKPQLSFTASLR